MSLANKLLSASGGGQLYSDDIFSAYTYTGNGATQTITNGIDLASKGGLVWCKDRTQANSHCLQDTATGTGSFLKTNGTYASTGQVDLITAFNATGFTLGNDELQWAVNKLANNYVSWTFRKAAKFFDVVTYTGNGANRTIPHSLGIAPGMIMIKRTDTTGSWMVYHNSIANTENLVLNTTAAKVTNATAWNSTTATASVFSLGIHADVNTNGGTYVAYLFAHDTSADGIIQCGSFATDVNGIATVSLEWEPQFIYFKRTDSSGNHRLFDTARGFSNGDAKYLIPNTSLAEADAGANSIVPTATGFKIPVNNFGASATFAYLAIRRPNKPPTVATDVLQSIDKSQQTSPSGNLKNSNAITDWVFCSSLNENLGWFCSTLLTGFNNSTGSPGLAFNSTSAETTPTITRPNFSLNNTTRNISAAHSTGLNYGVAYAFRRAPSVFDIVCYTGSGSATTVSHSLGVVPEMIIVKGRSNAVDWVVYDKYTGATKRMILNLSDATVVSVSNWNDTTPTNTVFTVGTGAGTNASSWTYVAYLFATKAGISKVGSYTGNGSTQTINCGFTTGCRFLLIKRTDSTGDWYVWDTVRGIVAGNDPHLSLNTTAAEISTDDSIDPDTSGFIVNQVAATNINVTSATYIFLAFA